MARVGNEIFRKSTENKNKFSIKPAAASYAVAEHKLCGR